jgi:DNA-binding MarR family transcriptional regulator
MNGHGAVPYTQIVNRSSSESFPETTIPRGYEQRQALLLHKLGTEVLERAEDPLAALGLSPRQYSLLAVLESDQPESQLELAALCGLMPAQVVPVLDELETRGLAERRRSEADRRRSVVRLTGDGRTLLARADALGDEIMDALFGHLDPAARAELGETLKTALERARQGP